MVELEMLTALAPLVAIIVAIFTIYFGFRNQQRLRAFEILINRNDSLLKDVSLMAAFYSEQAFILMGDFDSKVLQRFEQTEYEEARAL